MKVLIITPIYLPEMGALANRLYPFVRQLVAAGHEVVVATGMPNYPAGEVFPEYKGKLSMVEERDGYKIIRTNYLTVPRNKSRITQLLSYLSFMPAVFLSGLRGGKSDVVFITSPPIFPVIPAILLAKLRRAKLVFDNRDLWSDELISYGGLSEKSLAVRIARKLENWGYRQGDLVSATTGSLVDVVVNRGATPDKTMYLPNGADLELFKPFPPNNAVSREYPFGDRFVVMYSGLFGIKHGLETLLEAAEILRERKDIVFFMIGNGARRESLEQCIEEKSLENVIISGERDIGDIAKLISRSSICFAAIKSGPYPKNLISVKIFEYFACEKPVIGAVDGEGARVITESNGGIVVTPGDAHATANAILKLYEDPVLRKQMGKSGRRHIEQNFSRAAWAEKFEKKLSGLSDKSVSIPLGDESEKAGIQA